MSVCLSDCLPSQYFKAREVEWILCNPDVDLSDQEEAIPNLYLLLPAVSNNLTVTRPTLGESNSHIKLQ
jgi:hypothetical protein